MTSKFEQVSDNVIKTRPATLAWEDPFVIITLAENVFLDVMEAEIVAEALEQLTNNCTYGILLINRTLKTCSKEARDSAAKYHPPNLAATAIINTNIIALLMCNFYLKVSKPRTPNKVFKNEADARKWLLEMVSAHKPEQD